MSGSEYELFSRALDQEPGRRAAFLDEACGGDAALRQRLEKLLAAHERAELDEPVAPPLPPAPDPEGLVGRRVGGYELLRRIASGGMGTVFEARQQSPARTVALKLIGPGEASEASLQRFERESAVLARLQHPGIAQVFEAGCADFGFGPQPFFVMEYVDGLPLLQALRDGARELPARVELLARLADAVHHAHQRGVIHRDLKSDNVLVDARGHPKVLDFGIARLTDEGAERRTRTGQILGTLHTLSPEQVAGDPEAVGPASDQYALGVIAYELLSGALPVPVDPSDLAGSFLRIREHPPLLLGAVDPRLRGDLETIVARTLEKDPRRRYPSVQDLAADLRRHLDHQPILARPPSTLYQLVKFTRRHRGLVAGLAVAAIALLTGTAVAWREAVRANRQRIAAEDAASRAREARGEADRRAETTAAVLRFFNEELIGARFPHRQGRERTVAEVFDQADEAVEQRFVGRPHVELAIRFALAEVLVELGKPQRALQHLDHCDRLAATGGGSPEDAVVLRLLRARCDRLLGQHDAAEQSYRRMLQDPEELSVERRLALRMELVAIQLDRGAIDEVVAEAPELYAECVRELGEDHETSLGVRSSQASALHLSGRPELARPHFERVLEGHRALFGPDHPETLAAATNLAVNWSVLGAHDAAEALHSECVRRRVALYGAEHPETLSCRSNHAMAVLRQGRLEEGAALLREVLEARADVHGDDHPATLSSLQDLAFHHFEQGEFDRAATVLKEWCDPVLEEVQPHVDWGLVLLCYGQVRTALRDLDEAREHLDRAAEVFELAPGVSDEMREVLRQALQRLERLGG